MRLRLHRPSVRQAMLSVAVLAASLALVRKNYRPPLYGDEATIVVASQAERTAEGMAAHERRLASPENLRRAALDPRLADLKRPLRLGDQHEPIGYAPVPTVYVSVRSVEDGTLSIDSVGAGPAEARAIVLAVADAYIAKEGTSRIAHVAAVLPTACEFHSSPISSPSEVATAMGLGSLASTFVLFAPAAWFTKRRMVATAIIAPAAAMLLLEMFIPLVSFTYEPLGLVSAMIVSAAIGLGAMRRPWALLPIPCLICVFAPVTFHGWSGASLAAPGSLIAWVIGAGAGAVERDARRGSTARPETGGPASRPDAE